MTHAIKIFVVAAFATVSLMSAGNAQQPGNGGERKHHEQRSDPARSTAPKADDKAYNVALKSLANKPYGPVVGDALAPPSAVLALVFNVSHWCLTLRQPARKQPYAEE